MPGSAYSDPPTFVPLQKLTAALQNAIGDSIRALHWWGEGGSIPYAYNANQLEKLLKPSVDSLLKMGAAGVPSWLPITSVGGIHAKGKISFTPNGQTFIAWADITGASLTLVLAVTCTVMVWGSVFAYQQTAGNGINIRGVVDGVADTDTNPGNGGEVRNEFLGRLNYWTGVPAGSRIVKLQCQGTGTNAVVDSGFLMALAFAEN